MDTAVRAEVILEEPEQESEEEEEGGVYVKGRVLMASPRVSMEEAEVPIITRTNATFEERILEATPEAAAPSELAPCDTCGRKFNLTVLERHVKVGHTISGGKWPSCDSSLPAPCTLHPAPCTLLPVLLHQLPIRLQVRGAQAGVRRGHRRGQAVPRLR